MSGKRCTSEFKEEAVKQVIERGYTVREVAKRRDVSAHSLYKWVRAVRGNSNGKKADGIDGSRKIHRDLKEVGITIEEKLTLAATVYDDGARPGLGNRHHVHSTRSDVRSDIFEYIEIFYNQKRRHGHLNLVSPAVFEAAYTGRS